MSKEGLVNLNDVMGGFSSSWVEEEDVYIKPMPISTKSWSNVPKPKVSSMKQLQEEAHSDTNVQSFRSAKFDHNKQGYSIYGNQTPQAPSSFGDRYNERKSYNTWADRRGVYSSDNRKFDKPGGDRRFERSNKSRAPTPLPTEAPWKAYVGFLPNSITEEQLKSIFSDFLVKQVTLIKGPERPSPFAYVEFESLDQLKAALLYDGNEFQGQVLRVDVATPEHRDHDRNRNFDRSNRGGQRDYDRNSNSSPSTRTEDKKERRPLHIRPRTRPIEDQVSYSSETNNNPFGGAKPSNKDFYSDIPLRRSNNTDSNSIEASGSSTSSINLQPRGGFGRGNPSNHNGINLNKEPKRNPKSVGNKEPNNEPKVVTTISANHFDLLDEISA